MISKHGRRAAPKSGSGTSASEDYLPREVVPVPTPLVINHLRPQPFQSPAAVPQRPLVSPSGLYAQAARLSGDTPQLSRRPCQWADSERVSGGGSSDAGASEVINGLQDQIRRLENELESVRSRPVEAPAANSSSSSSSGQPAGSSSLDAVVGKQALDMQLYSFKQIYEDREKESKKRLDLLMQKQSDLKKEILDKTSAMILYKESCDDLRSQLNEMKGNWNKDRERHFTEMERSASTIREQERHLRELKTSLDGLSQKHKELSAIERSQKNSLSELESKYNLLKCQKDQKESESEDLLKEKDFQVYQLSSQLTDLTGVHEKSEQLHQQTALENTTLHRDLEGVRVENQKLESTLSVLQSNLSRLLSEKTQCEKDSVNLAEKLSMQRGELDGQRESNSRLRAEHQSLIRLRDRAVSDQKSKESELELCEGQLSSSRVRCDELESNLSQETHRHEETKKELVSARNLLDQARSDNIGLVSRTQFLETRLFESEEELRKLTLRFDQEEKLAVQLHLENEEYSKELEKYRKMEQLKISPSFPFFSLVTPGVSSLKCHIDNFKMLMHSNLEAAATIDAFMKNYGAPEPPRDGNRPTTSAAASSKSGESRTDDGEANEVSSHDLGGEEGEEGEDDAVASEDDE